MPAECYSTSGESGRVERELKIVRQASFDLSRFLKESVDRCMAAEKPLLRRGSLDMTGEHGKVFDKFQVIACGSYTGKKEF